MAEPHPRGYRKRQGSEGTEAADVASLPDDLSGTGSAPVAGQPGRARKTPRLRDLPTFYGKNIGEAQAFIAGADR